MASSPGTSRISSTTDLSRFSGTKPGPQPWILCGAFSPLVMTGDSAGSAPKVFTSGFFSLRYLPAPEMVPPVPMPATMASTLPSVSFQISSPVASWWISGLAGLSNWLARMAPGVSLTISAALALAPGTPSAPGVSTSSAPSRRMMARRSLDMVSGMVMMTL